MITGSGRPAGSMLSFLATVPRAIRAAVVAAYLVLVAVLSLAPPSAFPSAVTSLPGSGLAAHFLMYGGLAALLRWAVADASVSALWRWAALFSAILYGLAMEFMQKVCAHGLRFFSWSDVLVNAVGACAFWVIAGRILRLGRTAPGSEPGPAPVESRSAGRRGM